MNDSDEEYITRAAVFTEKLFTELENPVEESQEAANQQQQQRPLVRSTVELPTGTNVKRDNVRTRTAPSSTTARRVSRKLAPQQQQEVELQNTNLTTSLSTKDQPVERPMSKVSENDAKSENPVPCVNSSRSSAPPTRPAIPIEVRVRRQLVPIKAESDPKNVPVNKGSPEKRQEVELQEPNTGVQKPLLVRVPPIQRQKVVIPEIRSQSTDRIPEHHRKSFGGLTPQKVPIETEVDNSTNKLSPKHIQEVELQGNNIIPQQKKPPSNNMPPIEPPDIYENRSKSINRIPENHRKSFGGTDFRVKLPIVTAENQNTNVTSEEKDPIIKVVPQQRQKVELVKKQKEINPMPQKALPEKTQPVEPQAPDNSEKRPKSTSSTQRNENSGSANDSNVSRPRIPENPSKEVCVDPPKISKEPEDTSATRSVPLQQPASPQNDVGSSANSVPNGNHIPNSNVRVQPLMRQSRPLERRVRPIIDIPTQIEPPLPPSTEPFRPATPLSPQQRQSMEPFRPATPLSPRQRQSMEPFRPATPLSPRQRQSMEPFRPASPSSPQQRQCTEPFRPATPLSPRQRQSMEPFRPATPSSPQQRQCTEPIRPATPQSPQQRQSMEPFRPATPSSPQRRQRTEPNRPANIPSQQQRQNTKPIRPATIRSQQQQRQNSKPIRPATITNQQQRQNMEPKRPGTTSSQQRQPLNMRNSPAFTSSAPVNNLARPRTPVVRPPPPPVQQGAGFTRAPRPNQNRQPPPTRPINSQMNEEMSQLCTGVSNLTIGDPDFLLEIRQRTSVQHTDRIIPILGSSVPTGDQTTWVEEQTNIRNRFPIDNNQYNPGESLFVSTEQEDDEDNDITVEPINPAGEYPEMFTSFRRQLIEEEIRSPQRDRRVSFREHDAVVVDLGRNNNEPEIQPPSPISTRPSTSMSRRPPLLPPIAKGRIPPARDRRESSRVSPPLSPLLGPPTNVPSSSNNMPQVSLNSTDPALSKSSKEESKKTEHSLSNDAKYLTSLSSEDLEKMTEEELQLVTNSFYESGPRLKFKETFPFMAEGVVQKDCETGQLKVYSQRLGKIQLEDARWKKTEDYVYFVAIKPGVNRGLWFDTHPKCLVSAKFPSVERLVLRGYAILAHPNGSREDSIKENRWICWNDSLGLMPVISGSARTPLKKQPVWDKQLDIVSIHANYENRRFVVTKLVALTNSREKKDQFPEEVFLVQDAVFRRQCEDDLLFHSANLNAAIMIKRTLVGEVHTFEKRAFELVVVPTFPRCNALEFRAMLIIDKPEAFWKPEKEWIRELLLKKTESYTI